MSMDKESTQPRQEGLQTDRKKRGGRIRRWLKRIALGLVLLVAAAIALSALSNLVLPARSATIERLSDLDKARVLEAVHLRQT